MATKRKTKKRSKPQAPAFRVQNHRFEPGTKVSFLPVFQVGVERSLGREPMAKPLKTAVVKANGNLEVRGLSKGSWCAAGPVEDGKRWAYIQFPVA